MTGESRLGPLLRSMSPHLSDEVFVFLTFPAQEAIPPGLDPVMTFVEAEGRTLVVSRSAALAAGHDADFPSRMITLEVHSDLAAIGFLAAITHRLAKAGIAVNAVSAFFHDHLFVQEARAEEALTLLQMLSAECDAAEL